MSGKLHYGKHRVDGVVLDHPDEQSVIELVNDLYNRGLTGSEIMRYLNRNGYRKRIGSEWDHNSVTGLIIDYKRRDLQSKSPSKRSEYNARSRLKQSLLKEQIELGERPLCSCGCGGRVEWSLVEKRWQRFLRGHGPGCERGGLAYQRQAQIREFEYNWNPKRCGCGCGGVIPYRDGTTSYKQAKYVDGHGFQKNRDHGEAPDCLCGCGEKVRLIHGRWNKYISNHHPPRKERKSGPISLALKSPTALEIRELLAHSDSGSSEYSALMSRLMNLPEVKAAYRLVSLENFDNPDFVEKLREGQQVSPNKFERGFLDLCPYGFRFVGDGQLWLELPDGRRKNPDFIYGERHVVECHGDYWHKGEDSDELIGLYSEIGYSCLVIWEREMGDLGLVEERILAFLPGQLELRYD